MLEFGLAFGVLGSDGLVTTCRLGGVVPVVRDGVVLTVEMAFVCPCCCGVAAAAWFVAAGPAADAEADAGTLTGTSGSLRGDTTGTLRGDRRGAGVPAVLAVAAEGVALAVAEVLASIE